MIVAAGVLGVIVLFVMIYVANEKGRIKSEAGDIGVFTPGAGERSARVQVNNPPVTNVATNKGRINNAVVGETPKIDPSRYVDIQLIASCSGPRGECFDGAWWSAAGPKSTIEPHVRPGTPSPCRAEGISARPPT